MLNAVSEHFDLWSSAHTTKSTSGRGSNSKLDLHGIKKLRELILELAVRGKLVPQNPEDEPASILLERIAAEKAQLIKEKKIKKQKPLPAIEVDEKSFNLPAGWEWVRLGTLFNSILSGGTPSKREASFWNGGIPWASVKDLGCGRYISKTQDTITQAGLESGSKLADAGDILICTRMGLGKIAIAQRSLAFNQDLKAVKLASGINTEFFLNAFATIKIEGTGTTVSGIKQEQLLNYVIGLPTESEMSLIVAKINELMALCDQLEQQQTDSITAHQTLVEALLATLTNSTTADEVAENWARIAEHFDTLFTTDHSVDQLKQTVLQLAVMGRLVPQNPEDEPASVLLEKIANEKAQLVKDKKIKKQKPLPAITDEEKPFALPEGWEWVRFGSLVNIKSELVQSTEYPDFDQVAPDSIEKGTGRLLERRTVLEVGVKGPNNRFYKGQVLYSKIRPSLSKAIVAHFDGLCSADMYPMESMINPQYLLKLILSEVFLQQVRLVENRIKMPKLNIDSLSNIIVPLACTQQHDQIIDKVNDLMALCNTLKSQIHQTQTTQLHLANAMVAQAVA